MGLCGEKCIGFGQLVQKICSDHAIIRITWSLLYDVIIHLLSWFLSNRTETRTESNQKTPICTALTFGRLRFNRLCFSAEGGFGPTFGENDQLSFLLSISVFHLYVHDGHQSKRIFMRAWATTVSALQIGVTTSSWFFQKYKNEGEDDWEYNLHFWIGAHSTQVS